MGSGKRDIRELGSDYLREASVLILVFGFLDHILKKEENFVIYIAVFVVSAVFFGIGVAIESKRKD
jgi:uncharacterized membrane protein YczE